MYHQDKPYAQRARKYFSDRRIRNGESTEVELGTWFLSSRNNLCDRLPPPSHIQVEEEVLESHSVCSGLDAWN